MRKTLSKANLDSIKYFIRPSAFGVVETYRGCFDGWITTKVKADYNGCRRQYYMNKAVDWCFCKFDLCNGVSIDNLGAYKGEEPLRIEKYVNKEQARPGTSSGLAEEGYGSYKVNQHPPEARSGQEITHQYQLIIWSSECIIFFWFLVSPILL